jgi:hypothetical protein
MCFLFLNFILTYLKLSIMYSRFETTVNLRTFAFGVPVSDVTTWVRPFVCEVVTFARGTPETPSRGCAPARATMTTVSPVFFFFAIANVC